MADNRRSLRNYLLDRKYQLRYTAIMVAITALLTAGLGIVWYRQVREASKIIEVRAMASMAEDEVQTLGAEMRGQDHQRLLVLAVFGALLMLVITGYGITLTHKVAGPLYKIGRYMAAVQLGSLAPIGGIRKGDHLREFFHGFQQMHAAIRERAQQEVEALGTAIATLDEHLRVADAPELQRVLESLRALEREKLASLGQ